MKKILSLFLILLFSFCSKKRESNLPRIIVLEAKNVVEVNSKEMLHIPATNIIAKGFDKDVNISENNKPLDKEFWKKYKEEHISFKNFDTVLPKYKLKLTIDTTYTIASKEFEYKYFPIPPKEYRIYRNGLINDKVPTKEVRQKAINLMIDYVNKTVPLYKTNVECFPLLIENIDNGIAYINYNYIKIIQEAKDIDGKWKPIEFYPGISGCTVINSFYKLPPKKYLGIAIIKYNGNFKTKLRVKIKIKNHFYYSNEIEGFINRSQFNQEHLNDFIEFNFQRKLTDSEYLETRKYFLLEE